MATVIKSPSPFDTLDFSLFLAGSIDQGHARDWHSEVIAGLQDINVTILSPKREDWDETWEQCATCEPFRGQVLWEIKGMEVCDLMVVCFTAESKAPVTMFEFGAWGTTKDTILCVETGFYREANLQIYAEHFNVPIYHDLDTMITDLHKILEERA
jgi:hypothetical protein